MLRAAIYARYSTDMQSQASIEDQIRICEERATKEGWTVVQTYSDKATSGSSLIRPGIQQLMRDALAGKIDLVLAEALDRVSRDLEDVASVYKRLTFADVKMWTLSEGEITQLHIGLKGTMNEMFLKELADKTRRGLRGRVEQGKSGGGLTYGYEVVRRIDSATGEYVKGERTINEDEARIVNRIFSDFLRGKSPRSIAVALNKERIPGPAGKGWGASTIYGNRQRGTGILNNELYIGRLVWNRLRYVKVPARGTRVSKLNPESEWIVQDVPHLRIIDDELWEQAKRVQGAINRHDTPLWKKNRPKNLFSYLIKCGCCGGGFSMISADRLGCSTARNKGTCDNRLTLKRALLEEKVLVALNEHLMDEALCAEFCVEYTRRMNELRMQHNASLASYRAEYAKLERERQQIIKSIADGVPGAVLKDRAIALQARREELERLISETKEEPVLFHPNMARRYHAEIQTLLVSLNIDESRGEATAILRDLIDRIVVTPTDEGDRRTVDLIGDLAGILSIATKQDRDSVAEDLSRLQPVQQTDATDAENDDSADFCASTALVAGRRAIRDLPNAESFRQEAMVAGGRTNRDLPDEPQKNKAPQGLGSFQQVAMVAGTGFEPVTFRL